MILNKEQIVILDKWFKVHTEMYNQALNYVRTNCNYFKNNIIRSEFKNTDINKKKFFLLISCMAWRSHMAWPMVKPCTASPVPVKLNEYTNFQKLRNKLKSTYFNKKIFLLKSCMASAKPVPVKYNIQEKSRYKKNIK